MLQIRSKDVERRLQTCARQLSMEDVLLDPLRDLLGSAGASKVAPMSDVSTSTVCTCTSQFMCLKCLKCRT